MSVRVLLFTIGITTLTGVGFGLVPAFRATRVDAAPALKGSGKITPHGRRTTAGQVLVMAQIALCMVLIATAGLLGRSLVNLRTFDAGFEREHVLLFGVNMAGSEFSSDSRAATYSTLLDRLRGLPGVLAVSSSTRTPIDATASLRRITVPGFETPGLHGVSPNVITPDYLQNFGIGLLRGRALRSSDTNDSPKVAVVSQSMARFYFGGTDPIGRTFTLGDDNAATTVVGVVEDVRHERLRDQAPPKMVYTPLAQTSAATVPGTVTVAVRTSEHPAALAAAVRGEAGRVNPSAMVSYVRTMEQQLDAALVRERLLATLSAGFGMLALLLACVGLYGTMSYSVVRRSREISIRMALGAARMVVLRQILRESVTVTAAGVVIGTVAALWATRAVSAMLFDLSPRDPLTLASVAAILLTTALAAGFVPARKAASVEPATALRAD
jgi:predicted permease